MTNKLNNKIAEIKANGFTVLETNYYKNADKTFNFVTLKTTKNGSSEYIQLVKNGDDEWNEGTPEKLPFYCLPALITAKRILIVSSEAEVKELYELGIEDLAFTTTPNMAVKNVDFAPLQNKEIYFWRKNDASGWDFENILSRRLKDYVKSIFSVRIGDLDDIRNGDDILSWFKRKQLYIKLHKQAVIDLYVNNLDDLEIVHGSIAFKKRVEDAISGKFQNIPFLGMPKLSNLTEALLPGTITTTCATAGSGKTFWNIQNTWRWGVEKNLKVKILMMEDDQADHQARAVAQMREASGLTNPKVMELHPDFARTAQVETEEKLDVLLVQLNAFAKIQ